MHVKTLILFFLLTIVIGFFPSCVFAQDETATKPAAMISEETTPSAEVDYLLPYPGLLPDSPLYFLKTFRDKLIGFLVSDPLKKAEFNLLQADKRLNAGVYLMKNSKDKAMLAESTISKGENYFAEALTNVKDAKSQGLETDDMARRLILASHKHVAELKNLEMQAAKDLKPKYAALQKRVAEYGKKANSLLPK